MSRFVRCPALLAVLFAASAMGGVVLPYTATAGSSFVVDFNGAVSLCCNFPPAQQPVNYLSANAHFSDFVFTDIPTTGRTQVTFTMSIHNTSGAPLTNSQVASIGFLTTPNVVGGTASGAFNVLNLNSSTLTLGVLEVCAANVSPCNSAPGTGIQQGDVGTTYMTLLLQGTGHTQLTFDQMYILYNDLHGVQGIYNGIGHAVPEPVSFIVLSGGLALVAFRRRLFGKTA